MPNPQTKKQPKCPYGNQAKYICVNAQCRKSGLICEKAELTQSQCWLFHENCTKVKWSQIEAFSKQNIYAKSPQFNNLKQKIQNIFIKSLQKIQHEHQKFKIWTKTFGYNLQAMKFIKILIDRNYDQLTGEYMSNVMPSLLNKQSKRIQTPAISETDVQLIKTQIGRVLEQISGLYLKMKKVQKYINTSSEKIDYLNQSTAGLKQIVSSNNQIQKDEYKQMYPQIEFKSKIIDNFNLIRPFFQSRKVKTTNLIYRASQNNFSIKKFHEICDNIPETLILIHNQYGKKFGGYTPVQWTSNKKHWVADKSLRSFIFSIDMNEKFNLNLAQFAIASNPERGPTFGCCDICIVDNANKVQSNCQFPISYNSSTKYVRNQNTSASFTGNPKGQFLIKQWQVYRLEFE